MNVTFVSALKITFSLKRIFATLRQRAQQNSTYAQSYVFIGYRKKRKKKLLTRIISINLHIFSTELYTFSSNGLPHLNLDVQVFCVYGIRFQSLKKTYVHHYYRRLQKRKDKMPFKISFYYLK